MLVITYPIITTKLCWVTGMIIASKLEGMCYVIIDLVIVFNIF